MLPLPSLRRLLSTRLLRILALAGAAAACGTTGGHTLARIRHDGFVRIGYAVEAPYAYLADGRVTGESPEVARAIFARLGIDSLVWVQQDFGALIDDLRRGRFDVIAAGMFITPERERQIAFTVPTFCVTPALLVRRGNPRGLHGYDDLKADPAARIAVLQGAVEEQGALAAGVPARQLLAVPDEQTGLAAVLTGQADGLALSAPSINRLVRADTARQWERAEPFASGSPKAGNARSCGGLGGRQDDPAFLAALNRPLRAFVGTPEHLRLVQPFGFTMHELP